MKTHTVIKTTALILALITASITAAAAISCDCGDICVNETGLWRDSGAFNVSRAPIQAAVDNASAGETLCVKAGNYVENVDIATAYLTLTGAGADVVNVTNSTADHHVFKVTADYVNISGFNVTGATGSGKAGFYLNGADHCNISDNTALYNYDGIDLYDSSNNTLLNNTASNNDGDGIELWSSSNNKLTGNTANTNHYDGIYLDSSSNNTLLKNTASNNNNRGIYLWGSSNNIILNNAVKSNQESTYGHSDGIVLDSSSKNTLLNNTASNNEGDGIALLDSSSNNILTGNTADSNHYDGIYLWDSSNNIILNNTASNNDKHGIYVEGSSNNLIYNNCWSNADNAYDDGSNWWNITVTNVTNIIGGSFIGGNYWSDYKGADPDGDGLGNMPYNITGGSNFDHHPLCPHGASLKGDLNGDGSLTPADAAIALRLAATSAHDDAADVSSDGNVTSLDALMILQAAAGMVEL